MRQLRLLLPALFLAAAVGCSGGSDVSGEVTNNPEKPKPGEKWSITLSNSDSMYSGDTDENGKFNIPQVKSGSYAVRVTHYVPAEGIKAQPRPQEVEYPENWTVPGGPYKLDASKLPKPKKDPNQPGPK